jgi:CBS domain-containing protein
MLWGEVMICLPHPVVKSLMSEAVVMVDPTDELDTAEALMMLVDCRHIPVVCDGRLVGVISARDVLRAQARLAQSLRAREVMSHPVRHVGPYEDVAMAARSMIEHRISSLPVVDDEGTLVGMITSTDVVRDAVNLLLDGDLLPVRALMTPAPILTAGPDEPLDIVRLLMQGRPCRHMPVVDGGKLVGIVSDRDLLEVAGREGVAEMVARDVMTASPLTVPPGMAAADAGALMVAESIGALPVVRDTTLVGILTAVDFMRWRAERGHR